MFQSLAGILFVLILSSCGKNPPSVPTPEPQPSPPERNTPPVESSPPLPAPPVGPEKFEIFDSPIRDTAGWQVETSGTGQQSTTPSSKGVDLSTFMPFLWGNPGRCLTSSVSLKRTGVLKDLTTATVDLQFIVEELPANAEYWFRFEVVIPPGRRLFNFTGRGIRTFTPTASVKVSDTILSKGGHSARIVVKDDTTALYLDKKMLKAFDKGYLPGGNPGDVIVEFALPEKFPVKSADECPTVPAKVTVERIRASKQAYFQP